MNSSEVGIKDGQTTGNYEVLRFLIEKDFACLEPRKGDKDLDAFPHSSGNKKC